MKIVICVLKAQLSVQIGTKFCDRSYAVKKATSLQKTEEQVK